MLCRKKMSVITGLDVSSLALKCVFFGPEQNIMQKGDTMKLMRVIYNSVYFLLKLRLVTEKYFLLEST